MKLINRRNPVHSHCAENTSHRTPPKREQFNRAASLLAGNTATRRLTEPQCRFSESAAPQCRGRGLGHQPHVQARSDANATNLYHRRPAERPDHHKWNCIDVMPNGDEMYPKTPSGKATSSPFLESVLERACSMALPNASRESLYVEYIWLLMFAVHNFSTLSCAVSTMRPSLVALGQVASNYMGELVRQAVPVFWVSQGSCSINGSGPQHQTRPTLITGRPELMPARHCVHTTDTNDLHVRLQLDPSGYFGSTRPILDAKLVQIMASPGKIFHIFSSTAYNLRPRVRYTSILRS